MTDHTQTIDGTAEEIGSEVEHYQPAPADRTLFATNDPVEVVQRASRAAGALADVIEQRKLYKQIQGRKHVLVEGWTTLGSMLGVVPVVVWSRPTGEPTDKGSDWEARVEARTLDGRVVGAAEATCSRKESTWAKRDDYALRSMAQTRATSKALRGPLGFIVTLAGYEATPEAEMPAEAPQEPQPEKMSPELYRAVVDAFQASTVKPDALSAWLDQQGVKAQDELHVRVSGLEPVTARRLKKWLDGQRAEATA